MFLSGRTNPLRLGITFTTWFSWIGQTIIAGSAVVFLSQIWPGLSGPDFRLGLVVAASVFLLTLIVEDQFPLRHLLALRAVRQNLAFNRISLDAARVQIDSLLLAGRAPSDFVREKAEAILARLDDVRSLYAQIEGFLPKQNSLRWEAPPGESAGSIRSREEFDRLSKHLESTFKNAIRQHEKLIGDARKLNDHIQFMGSFSPSTAHDLAPLLENVKAVLAPLATQREKLKPQLIPLQT